MSTESTSQSAELFRSTLRIYLNGLPRGSQSKLADDLGVDRRYMNDFLNGRKMFSEEKREIIALLLGFDYLEFLCIGQMMLDADMGRPLSTSYSNGRVWNFENLSSIISAVEHWQTKTGVDLSPEKKAFLIAVVFLATNKEIDWEEELKNDEKQEIKKTDPAVLNEILSRFWGMVA